jgi:hypothetical protein
VRLISTVLAAVLIGCSGAGDEDSFDGVDGGSESSSSKSGRGERALDDDGEGEDVGELGDLGAHAGSGATEPDAGEHPQPDAAPGDDDEPDKEPAPCMPGEYICLAGSCTRCASGTDAGTLAGGTGGSAGSAGSAGGAGGATPVCSSDTDGDGVCDDHDRCPNASDQDANEDGYADACDTVLWADEFDLQSDRPTCDTGHKIRSWIEIKPYANNQVRSLSSTLFPPTSVTWVESFPADSTADAIAAVSALDSFDASVSIHTELATTSPLAIHRGARAVDLRSKTVVRLVFLGSFSEACQANGTHVIDQRARWEIRGY